MNLYTIKKAEKQATFCKIMSNPRRLLILWILKKGELSVNEIASQAGSSLQNVSQHLGLLKKHGILKSRRDGHNIYHQIAENEFLQKCPAIQEAPDHIDKNILEIGDIK